MQLILYKNFVKRGINSTKQPTSSTTQSIFDVMLKSDTSLTKPTFQIGNTIDSGWVYAQFAGRYYFITDIRLAYNNIYEVECELDRMATYKSQVGAYQGTVERGNSNWNHSIPDTAYMPSIAIKRNLSTVTLISGLIGTGSDLSGCYLLQTTSNNQVYILTDTQVQLFISAIRTGSLFSDYSDYVVSLKWCPFAYANVCSYADQLAGGLWLGSHNLLQSETLYVFAPWLTGDMVLNFAPAVSPTSKVYSSNQYDDWRDYDDRFTKVSITLMGNTHKVAAVDYFNWTSTEAVWDYFSGEMTIRCFAGSRIFLTDTKQCCYDIRVSNLSGEGSYLVSLGGSVVSLAAGIAAENPMLIAGGALSLINAATKQAESPSTMGNNGARSDCAETYKIRCNHLTLDTVNTTAYPELGYPVMKYDTVSNYTGYIKMYNAAVQLPGFTGDAEAVNNIMNGGFYYE